MIIPQIPDFKKYSFSALTSVGKEVTHDVYEKGEGPVVLIIQELPGIGQETLRLAALFLEKGFRVVMPHLFGPLGKTNMAGNLVKVMCMYKEFHIFSSNKTSPIVNWLRALCQHLVKENNSKGVGVIGMCLTGNFAISLMVDESVMAAVASQPSLPVQKGSALHMSEDEIQIIKSRLDQHGPMKAFRFEGDGLCPARRFKALQETFNSDEQERIQLRVLPGKGHSVLTIHFNAEDGHPTKEALEEIFDYFGEKLRE